MIVFIADVSTHWASLLFLSLFPITLLQKIGWYVLCVFRLCLLQAQGL